MHCTLYHGVRICGLFSSCPISYLAKEILQCLGVTAHAEDIVLLYSDSTSALAYAKDLKYHEKPNTLSFGTTTFEIWFHKGK